MNPKEIRYFERTLEHIHRVQKNMFLMITKYNGPLQLSLEDCRLLAYQVMIHDRSKFSDKQFAAYIELTEYYYQKKKCGDKEYKYPTEEIKKAVDEAVKDHYIQENHHAEKHRNEIALFSRTECLEIICDLQAMAQEFNEGNCLKYFENIWRPKYLSLQQNDLVYLKHIDYMRKIINCFLEE